MLSLLLLSSLPQAGAWFDKPAWARFASPTAADHVAVMRVRRGWGAPGEDRATITRSGGWLREDIVEAGKRSTSISDLRSGLSYHFARGGDGRYARLTISGRPGAVRLAVEKTRQTDHLLGEACTVWSFKADNYTEKNCLTADGILLWQSVVAKSGAEISSARAISIVRRRVRPREARPPADLLRLESWTATAVSGSRAPNDEVVLRASPGSRAPVESLDIRRLGSAVFTDRRNARGRTRTFSGGGTTLTLDEQPDGELVRLDIVRAVRSAGPSRGPVPLASPRTKTILGETCTLYDMAPGVADFAQTECRTRDGIVLEQSTWTRGRGATLTAVSIVRGKLRPADLAPPASILAPR